MVKRLQKSYPSRYGTPSVHSVDTSIFEKKYFTGCLQCGFCNDACCLDGVDVDRQNVERIETHADKLERYLGIHRDNWFTRSYIEDSEFPGGSYTRTRVLGGACVFHDQHRRGCTLHRYCLENNIDYHELKPMVSCLFPLTFDEGVLHPADEAESDALVCLGDGPTLYRGVRDELLYYFDRTLVHELDGLEVGSMIVSSV